MITATSRPVGHLDVIFWVGCTRMVLRDGFVGSLVSELIRGPVGIWTCVAVCNVM